MAGVVHISEEEAARDFAALMRHIRSGDEVRLDCGDGVKAVVKSADDEPVKARSITAIIEGFKQREEAQGLAIPDDEFATDVADARARYNGRHNTVPVRRTIAEAREILRFAARRKGWRFPILTWLRTWKRSTSCITSRWICRGGISSRHECFDRR